MMVGGAGNVGGFYHIILLLAIRRIHSNNSDREKKNKITTPTIGRQILPIGDFAAELAPSLRVTL